MRIWDLEPSLLCNQHLLGEHRELHGCWRILTLKKKGYSRHPETQRWVGKEAALYARHEALVAEMRRRGWTGHKSDLDETLIAGSSDAQDTFLHTIEEQIELIRAKGCDCRV